MADFSHLHVHSQYSLLDGAAGIDDLLAKAQRDGMPAMAITDHGNMFGTFKFVTSAEKYGVKPIIGCEFYMAPDMHDKGDKTRFHQLLLAKNEVGYRNISKLCSLGFVEGYYYHPRIDKALLKKHKEGLIATTCCLAAEVPRTIINQGEEAGEKVFKEWLDLFGEDYYIELQRHGIKEQEQVNTVLLKWAEKYNVKVIATNDSHYVEEEDWEAHDILLCLQTGSDLNEQNRFKFENNQFFFKSTEEMAHLFKDIPQALENTLEIVDKIETPNLKRDVLLPNYSIPKEFSSEQDYLRHLSFEGARQRYGEITSSVQERLDYELKVIGDMGFPGYFLIVQDFVQVAKDMGVSVGPGRGSAAGSAIAYCTGITNIDPIKYNLLFERFLNPERVSMPDIDIDFDDEGRQRVIDYVVDKYTKEQVAQIVTFGTMAAKSAIRDVGRVLQLPLPETDKLAKLVPDTPGTSLEDAFKETPELADYKKKGSELTRKTLEFAEVLEGSVRHTGIHAAGVIIAPDNLMDHIPVCKQKDSELLVTQYDGKVIEDAGMLKMDFLGLKTLSIIKDAIANVKRSHNIDIVADDIPLDDEKTFELFQRADTVGIFQFESNGMRNYLKDLKPTNIEDLIAMNALYRPGPMDHIPEFVNRKHGKSPVTYPHDWLEDILKPTYGIMVYQEQIMQTAQIVGGFTLGAADILRRAMGKKKHDVMEQQKKIFVEGATAKGVDPEKAQEIFSIMEKFASYGFNRSHSAAYSVLAFQTAYLKAHYPAEFIAAVLTHNMNDIKQVNFFMKEASRLGIDTLGPDINESDAKFVVNKDGAIRFALTAVKGVGGAAVENLIEERDTNGSYESLFNISRRVNTKAVNRKCVESLVLAGAFDSFEGLHRAQYFAAMPNDTVTVIEKAMKLGAAYQASLNSSQNSLFGEESIVDVQDPEVPEATDWDDIERLNREKEVTGIYISGHPLNDYELELNNFCVELNTLERRKNRPCTVGGIVSKVEHRVSKKGNRFGRFGLEDFTGTADLALFGEGYLKWKHLLEVGELLYIKGVYQARYKSEDMFELKINEIQLLADVKDSLAKKLTLEFGLTDINNSLVEQMLEVVSNNPGNCEVKLKVIDTTEDTAEKYSVDMASTTYKVNLNDQVKGYLNSLPRGTFRFNQGT